VINGPQQDPRQQQPTIPVPAKDRKPIANMRYLLWALCLFIGVVFFIQVNRFRGDGSASQQQQKKDKPSAATGEQVKNFQKQQEDQAKRIQQEAQLARERLAAINKTIEAYDQMGAEAPGVPPPTAEQRRAMLAGSGGAPSPGQPQTASPEKSARQKAEEDRVALRKAAQESSTVAVDFSDSIGKDKVTVSSAAKSQKDAETESSERQEGSHRTEGASSDDAESGRRLAEIKSDDALLPLPQGRVYKVLEGTLLECVLTNRLTGSFSGPVNVMLTTPVYSHDHQTLLFPQGTRILGTVTGVRGQQDERLFVAFHRAVLPTGFSVNLDQYIGLAQQGQTGLRDQVDRHYFQIFGASVALSAIDALGQAGANSTGSASVRLQTGTGQGTANASTRIIEQMLIRLPTFTIRERTRVKIYISKDLTVGAYDPNYHLDPI